MRYSASQKLETIRLVEHLPPAGSSHARANPEPEIDVLWLVRSVSDRRARGAGRSQSPA